MQTASKNNNTAKRDYDSMGDPEPSPACPNFVGACRNARHLPAASGSRRVQAGIYPMAPRQ